MACEERFHTTGTETWFSLPERPVAAPPPFPLRALIFPIIIVPLLTYVIMPRLSRLLLSWLYSGH